MAGLWRTVAIRLWLCRMRPLLEEMIMLVRPWHSAVLSLSGLVFVLLLVSCTQASTPAPTPVTTPIPPIKLAGSGGSAKASGKIVPAQKVELGFPAAGRVQRVTVTVGQQVPAGTVLIVL